MPAPVILSSKEVPLMVYHSLTLLELLPAGVVE
jgi:hypothetical protein